MTGRTRSLAPFVALLIAVTAACGGNDADTSATTLGPATDDAATTPVTDPPETDPAVTDPPATDPVVTDPPATDPPATDPVDSGPVGTDPDLEQGALLDPATIEVVSVADLLHRLPLSAVERVLADDGSVTIESSDLAAAATLQGIEPAADPDGRLEVLLAVSNPAPIERDGSGLGVFSPAWPQLAGGGQFDEVVDEFGFSLLDVESYVSLASSRSQMTVLGGDLALSDGLVDLGNGVLSAGDGEDFETALDARTPARPLGRPHRFATGDDLVAVALETSLIETWLADGPTAAEVPVLRAAAEALDRSNVVSSLIQWGGLAIPSAIAEVIDEPLSVPFEALGMGVTAIDGNPANVVAYVFDGEEAAESAVAEITSLWNDGTLATTASPVDEMFHVVDVERVGAAVVVTAVVDESTTTLAAFQLLYQREPLFGHA